MITLAYGSYGVPLSTRCRMRPQPRSATQSWTLSGTFSRHARLLLGYQQTTAVISCHQIVQPKRYWQKSTRSLGDLSRHVWVRGHGCHFQVESRSLMGNPSEGLLRPVGRSAEPPSG